MEGSSDAPLHDEIDEIKGKVITRISEKLACLPPNPLFLRICKVQDNLRSVNKMAYEPIMLSIGPYHHGKAHLKKMEDLKLRYLQSLLERRSETDASRYVEAMTKMEEKVRECYADPISLGRDEFVMMMVVDGCFIVELFIKHFNMVMRSQRSTDDLILDLILEKASIFRSIHRDLLLCENQLPYFILLELFKMIALPDEENFYVHAQNFFWPNLGRGCRSSLPFTRFDAFYISFNHLLSMIYYDWCPPFTVNISLSSSPPFAENIPTSSSPGELENWIFKISATELREAGIKFKSAKKPASTFEIKFNNGVLEIPPLTIDCHTESLFRNLLAYEHQPEQFTLNYITDYIRFMDILIDSEKDVQILRHRGIIQNGLGDDEAVCTMFNKFCENLIFRGNSWYCDVLINMEKHCRKRCHRWMAKLKHNYFNSPWAWISVLAAAFAILLTVAQTVYAIISYHKK